VTSVLLLALVLGAAPATPAKAPPKAPAKAATPVTVPAPAAAPSRPPPAASDSLEAKDVRVIPIDEQRAGKVYRIRTAAGYPAIIELPDAFAGPPSCGDCGENGLFRLDVFESDHYLTVKPRLFPGVQSDGTFIGEDEFVTTINVRLASQLTLTLQVELAPREKADARVVFKLPQREGETAYVRAEIAKARRKLEEEFAGKLQAATNGAFLRALADPHHCEKVSYRTRQDDAVVEISELCTFSTGVYIRFAIDNRGRVPFDVADVTLKRRDRDQAQAVPDAGFYLPQLQVEFQSTIAGVVGFPLAEGDKPARTYDLSVYEKGGRNRTVTVPGIGF